MSNNIKNIIGVLLGNTIYAFGVLLFVVPNGLITGGSTGLGIAANHLFGVPIPIFISIFNGLMFFIGLFFLGKRFAFSTLISTFYFPFILGVLENTIGYTKLTSDPLVAALFGGVLIGTAIGIVVRCHASTGGMDIPPLILNKKLAIPVSVSMYAFDFMILLAQVFYTDTELVFYGIILVATYTMVLDKVLLLGKSQTEVQIISKEYEKISELIRNELDRGTTLIDATSGYLKNEYPIVMSVISNRELPKLNNLVNEIDDHAFMIVNKVNEVHGRGFTFKKEYFKK